MNIETEDQRAGRNKDTSVNRAYVNTGEFRRKFDAIANDLELGRLLYKIAKDILNHRSGTKFEDMYWIDLDTLEVFAKEVNCSDEKRIVYSPATEREILRHKNILTIHSHPDSFPPSIEDFISNYERNYRVGVVICHNGTVYLYSADEAINRNYYNLVVERHMKQGYNENEAQILALKKIQENFLISFREVTSDGCI